jgi:hypothetical protein
MSPATAAAAACLPADDAAGAQIPVPGMEPAQPAPCILAANRTGMYHEVLRFDAAAEAEVHYMRQGVAALALVDGSVAFRVSAAKYPYTVLQHYSRKHGWTQA